MAWMHDVRFSLIGSVAYSDRSETAGGSVYILGACVHKSIRSCKVKRAV